jgi:hypothetical protein
MVGFHQLRSGAGDHHRARHPDRAAERRIFGQAVWSKLRTHPKVTAAVYPNGGNATAAALRRPQAVADLFELDEVIVGQSFLNSAKPGQTPSLARVWGKHAAFIYRAPQVGFADQGHGHVRFHGAVGRADRRQHHRTDPNVGLRGGNRVRVGESVAEVIAANDAAYFFQNAVA